tara:strand:+ start:130 stop:534 length:405 start_codon:yes stop_codon:yes gene_type:complete
MYSKRLHSPEIIYSNNYSKKSRVEKSRADIFKQCNYKILEVETLLTQKSEIKIDASSGPNTQIGIERFDRRGGILSQISPITDIARINVQERGNNAHSIIVVKNPYLLNGWSIFDANGKSNLPFKIYNKEQENI